MSSSPAARLTNYAAFVSPETGDPRIGHLDPEEKTIQPLSFASGTPIRDLYQVIEVGASNIVPAGNAIPVSSVKLLPPISGRDVLAVGKNYSEHAKEFNSSGYDSSDKVDMPSHPVIFTKRATSIIADGEDILLHDSSFTTTTDYEGEIGVIVKKAGFQISEEESWDYVWGYTIINDVSARERQRDHKQFYIGKSPDTFCPMGPVAVPKEELPKTLRVQTHVNGDLRQDATTDDLIFSIPTLISTLSAAQTLRPGDVLATGTPAGVGFGQKPPVFLQAGDEIKITVTGLGSLQNKVAGSGSTNPTISRVTAHSALELTNAAKSIGGKVGLTQINNKPIHYMKRGSGSEPFVFVHGLGGTMDFWTPLISSLALEATGALHLYDFEGHGLSPTHPLSQLTISSLAADLAGVFQVAEVSKESPATLFAHSMGALVAFEFLINNPGLVKKLVLVGPSPSPLPEAESQGAAARAALARSGGMAAIVDAVSANAVSDQTKSSNPIAVAALRFSLLGQDPEAYAKACTALARATSPIDVGKLDAETLVLTGESDIRSPPSLCEKYAAAIPKAKAAILPGVGHWPIFEDLASITKAVKEFL